MKVDPTPAGNQGYSLGLFYLAEFTLAPRHLLTDAPVAHYCCLQMWASSKPTATMPCQSAAAANNDMLRLIVLPTNTSADVRLSELVVLCCKQGLVSVKVPAACR